MVSEEKEGRSPLSWWCDSHSRSHQSEWLQTTLSGLCLCLSFFFLGFELIATVGFLLWEWHGTVMLNCNTYVRIIYLFIFNMTYEHIIWHDW
jgi:hypothetical protein